MINDLDRVAFDELVRQALDTVPEALTSMIDNCVILVEEFPPPDDPGLLGLYEGVPLTERGGTNAAMLPDRILIFRQPIMAACATYGDVVREVRITVVHEIAHHFGIDDKRLEALGYG